MRIILVIFSLVFIASSASLALPKYLDAFKKNYPDAAGTKLSSCAVCHPVKGKMKEQSSFALDFKKAGHDLTKIEALDSDKDRFTNSEEIAAGTFPQDKNDKPDIPALVKQIKELKRMIEGLEEKLKTRS